MCRKARLKGRLDGTCSVIEPRPSGFGVYKVSKVSSFRLPLEKLMESMERHPTQSVSSQSRERVSLSSVAAAGKAAAAGASTMLRIGGKDIGEAEDKAVVGCACRVHIEGKL